MKKIAFLFLTRGNLHHDQIWKDFFSEAPVSIYTHASQDKPLQGVLKGTRIPVQHQTSWGKTALAHRELLKTALKDPLNYKFVLCSESCVPLRSFQEFYSWVTNDDNSIIKWDPIQGENLRVVKERIAGTNLKLEDQRKHAANYCLNRRHAEQIAAADVELYQGIESGDELFLSLLDHKDQTNQWVVFSDWEYTQQQCDYHRAQADYHWKQKQNSKHPEKHRKKLKYHWKQVHELAKHPRTFDKMTPQLLALISPYFFARKFSQTSDIKKYLTTVAGRITAPGGSAPRGGFPLFS